MEKELKDDTDGRLADIERELKRREIEQYEREVELLKPFYSLNDKGKPTRPLEDKIAQYVIDNHHIIVINNRPYIYENGVYKLDKDGKTVKSLIKVMLLEKDKKATTIKGIYNLIIDNPAISFNYEEVNKYPKHWINFKNGMLDVKTLTMHEHDPGHYSINQIPHNYEPNAVYKDTVADLFVRDIVPDKADRDMFYTYCGYCMTRETFLQKFLVIIGAPGTGKSTLLNMVIDTIGEENISAIELDQINKQFMSTFCLLYTSPSPRD